MPNFLRREQGLIRESGLFDKGWYIENYSLGASTGSNPISDYIRVGARLGRAPHPLFDMVWYAQQFPEIETSKLTPLGHYLHFGENQGVSPHPLFDPEWYGSQLSAAEIPREGLLRHFIKFGLTNQCSPHPAFNTKYYLSRRPDVLEAGVNPLRHFIEYGADEGTDPNPFFDVAWYVSQCRNLKGRNPLIHFLTEGAAAGMRPCRDIDLSLLPHPELPPAERYVSALKNPGSVAVFNVPRASGIQEAEVEPIISDDRASLLDVGSYAKYCDRTDRKPSVTRAPNEVATPDFSDAEFVSFDIWDTILRRDCHPDEIKLQSARFLLLAGFHSIRPAFRDIITLYRMRIISENKAAPNDEFEFRFTNAVDVWLGLVVVPGTVAKALSHLASMLYAHELNAERNAIRLDPAGAKLVERAGPHTVFISDFYLGRRDLQSLLNHVGIGNRFLRGYASSDSYETKRSGRMFLRVLRDLAIAPNKLIHVGDNPKADGTVPAAFGIRTVDFQVKEEKLATAWYHTAFEALLDGDATLHERRILSSTESVAEGLEERGMRLEAIGARLAPVFLGFTLSVMEDSIRENAKNVFFFTREGVFFRQLYDLVAKSDPFGITIPASRILSVSRRATFAPSLKAVTVKELMRLWSLYSSQSVAGFTNSLNLENSTMRAVSARYGIAFTEIIQYPWENKRFLSLLDDAEFKAHAKRSIDEQRELLSEYLQQENFGIDWNTCNIIVDVGWRGTIQDNLARLSSGFLRGHYLGLFKFLNKQSENTSKRGWLGDDNGPNKFDLSEVAHIEAICNSLGGSVIGYRRQEERIVPITQVVAGEEKAISDYFVRIQNGVLAAAPTLTKYIRLHGLGSSDLARVSRDIASALDQRPPALLADAFFDLHHNESFGTGGIENISGDVKIASILSSSSGSELHYLAAKALSETRWLNAFVRQSSVHSWWKQASSAARAALPAPFTTAHCPAIIKARGSRACIFVPPPIRGSGGHRTFFNLVRVLASHGLETHVFLEALGDGIEVAERFVDGAPVTFHSEWHRHIPCDIAMATVAHSAMHVRSVMSAHHRGYLVQDYESLFNPVSDAYLVGEESYSCGLRHFTIGNWLTHVLANQYRAWCSPSGLGVDTKVYRPVPSIQREKAICFLYQPDKPRRTPIRGISILRRVSQLIPGVKIYVYGSNAPLYLDFPVENLGHIDNLDNLNTLYNKCIAGLCISASNPSRIPYEMMAAGCIPVDLYRYNNLMDHRPGTAVLAYQGVESMTAAIVDVVMDAAKTAQRRKVAIKETASRTLQWEMDVIANTLLALLSGEKIDSAKVSMTYTDPPYIAGDENNPEVRSFCEWQRNLAQISLPNTLHAGKPGWPSSWDAMSRERTSPSVMRVLQERT